MHLLVQSTGWVNPLGVWVWVGRVWVQVTIYSPLHKPIPVNGLTGVPTHLDPPTTYLKYVVERSKCLAGGLVGGVWRTGWVLVAAGRWRLLGQLR